MPNSFMVGIDLSNGNGGGRCQGDETAKALRGEKTCQRSHRQKVAGPGFISRSF